MGLTTVKGIENLGQHMNQLASEHPYLPCLLCSDFNARTAELSDADYDDSNRHVHP